MAGSRSWLQFDATAGTLGLDDVSFVITRPSDGKYWDGQSSSWQAEEAANAGSDSSGTWTYAVTGVVRKAFADTAIKAVVRATEGSTVYTSDTLSVTVR